MSKYIDEIVSDVRSNPDTWIRTGRNELSKGEIRIGGFGNGSKYFFNYCTSIVNVYILGIRSNPSNLTTKDKGNLEEIFIWWIQNSSLNIISKQK